MDLGCLGHSLVFEAEAIALLEGLTFVYEAEFVFFVVSGGYLFEPILDR